MSEESYLEKREANTPIKRDFLEGSKGELPLTFKTSENVLTERKKKAITFLKEKKEWVYYSILAIFVWISLYIRTRNIPGLKDITTNSWTLGPDLDPFLFLRWAEYIVEHGKLMIVDFMRNVPLGMPTEVDMKLLSYLIAWLHKFLEFFSISDNVTYSAILFPVLGFALTTIAFFLFAREIFYRESNSFKNIGALIATSLFILIPSLLPRTIAGIPEKESIAFFFMFLAFYFFIKAFNNKKLKSSLIFGVLAGISTGLMGLVWGGVIFIYLTISSAILLSFIFGKIKKREIILYGLWLFSSFIVMMPFSIRYTPLNLISSFSTGFSLGVLLIITLSFFMDKSDKIRTYRRKIKLPKEIFNMIVSLIIVILLFSIMFGPSFIFSQISEINNNLIEPSETRFSFTVAENKQPYFADDWKNNFGPVLNGIPIFFWLFFIGTVILFSHLIKKLNKKEKAYLIFSYTFFLTAIIFSRYSANHTFNGLNNISLLFYLSGAILFLGVFIKIYLDRHKENHLSIFEDFNFAYILYFIILTLGIIGARGAIRLIMVLGAVAPVSIGFLNMKIIEKFSGEKEELLKTILGVLLIIVALSTLFTFYSYYKIDKSSAQSFIPGPYQQQWQKAMAWVRENTPENAVFAHWWDYGYWVQSIGKRATILDGGNAIVYWNHLMGRHVLTSPNERDSLEFLYAHNGTHLLIDSTEIGKYTAFSSIGADENYDRFSWINTMALDESQTVETNNETIFVYSGGTVVDDDIVWEENGTKILFPKRNAAVGAIILRKGQEFKQPEAIFVYNGKQYTIPLRYAYINDNLKDFGSGLEAGIFVFPLMKQGQNGQIEINDLGALLYLSERTINSRVAQLYLFDQPSNYFELAHTESSYIIENLRSNGYDTGEFIEFRGFNGPIKIWEVTYPSDIKANPEYLKTAYPNKEIEFSVKGEYS